MSESRRILEQEALRNVRALIERLGREELARRKRQKYLLLIASVPIAYLLVSITFGTMPAPIDPAKQQSISCELDAWNARAADFERRTRQANPEMPYRDIQKLLEKERPFMLADAKIDCSSKATYARPQ